jgi:WD40 repeat protein
MDVSFATTPTRERKVIAMQDRQIPSSTQAPLRKQPTLVQRFGILAAGVCLVALVVGGIAMVFFTSRQNTPGLASVGTSHPTATARPTLVVYHPGKSLGKLVYSTTLSDTGVFGLAWSPDSTRLGVATESAQSWVATTGKGVVNYGSMGKGVVNYSLMAVVWSPDGKLVAVTGGGQGVQLYNASTGVLWKTYPDNGQAATASASGGYLSAQVTLSGGSGSGATAWSPDGHLMATAFFGSYGQAVQVWNTSTGHLVQTYTGQADVESLSWSADGTYVASSGVASSGDDSIQVWNALTGQRIYDFESNQRCNHNVAWSPDGKTLAYLNCDQVRVVNPFTGQLLKTHTGPHDSFGLSALAWSPDGKYLVSAGDHIEVWSVATGRTYYTFTKNASPIYRLAWSPDGKYLASANFTIPPFTVPLTIQVWSAE